MAVLWHLSLTPRLDPSGDPYSGAKAYFFDVGTTTPQIVYTEAALSIPHDHPVLADSSGVFPAVFFEDETSHRLRITTAADVTLHDVDNIAVPTTTPPEFPETETPTELLFQTGDIKMRWAVAAQTGWVRLNGRTIGSAASGAAERANADCEDLFIFLWDNDANLSVSGGRGGTATGDWSANKTIALPDWRGRIPVGPDSFGNSAAGRITDAVLGADSDLLGAAGGAQQHTLTEAQMPAHTHTVSGTTNSTGDHTHTVFRAAGSGGTTAARDGGNSATGPESGSAGDHSHTVTGTAASTGSGTAHNNLQPSLVVPFFIKL